MLDFGFFGDHPGVNVQTFTPSGGNLAAQTRTWIKPRGISFVHIVCIGSGGAGGSSTGGPAGTARGGGGGGGSSGASIVFLPALYVPEVLHVLVGAALAFATGLPSFVAVGPGNNSRNMLAHSGGQAPVGVSGAAAAGAGGAAATTPTLTDMPLGSIGVVTFLPGQAGTAAGAVAGAVGLPQSYPSTGITCGGTGGGSTTAGTFAGGLFNASGGQVLLDDVRPAFAPAGSNPGSQGFLMQKPFFSFPGLGGGSINAANGGAGGNGGPGSGGGGGGAGTAGGGAGGRGGDGLVIIASW